NQAGKPGSFLVGVVTVMTRPKPVRHGKSRPPVRVPGGRGARLYTRTRLKMPRQDVGAIVSNYAASLRPPTFTTPAELLSAGIPSITITAWGRLRRCPEKGRAR